MAALSRTRAGRCALGAAAATALAASVAACTGHSAPSSSSAASAASSTGAGGTASAPASGGAAASGGPTASLSPSAKISRITTTVAPPSPGSVRATVATRSVVVLPGVSLKQPVNLAAHVAVRIARITAVQAVSHVPGEVNGPAVEVAVTITNTSSSTSLDVSSAEVDLADSHGGPGIPVTTAASRVFRGTVKPGAHVTGTYDFRVATNRRDPVTVTASYTGAGPVATFVGPVK